MKLPFCCACGHNEGLESHHLLPLSEGGTDDETNILTLCFSCHGKIHGMVRRNISELTKQGIAKSRLSGKIRRPNNSLKSAGLKGTISNIAAKRRFNESMKDVIAELRENGFNTMRELSNELNRRKIFTRYGNPWYQSSVNRLINDIKKGTP